MAKRYPWQTEDWVSEETADIPAEEDSAQVKAFRARERVEMLGHRDPAIQQLYTNRGRMTDAQRNARIRILKQEALASALADLEPSSAHESKYDRDVVASAGPGVDYGRRYVRGAIPLPVDTSATTRVYLFNTRGNQSVDGIPLGSPISSLKGTITSKFGLGPSSRIRFLAPGDVPLADSTRVDALISLHGGRGRGLKWELV